MIRLCIRFSGKKPDTTSKQIGIVISLANEEFHSYIFNIEDFCSPKIFTTDSPKWIRSTPPYDSAHYSRRYFHKWSVLAWSLAHSLFHASITPAEGDQYNSPSANACHGAITIESKAVEVKDKETGKSIYMARLRIKYWHSSGSSSEVAGYLEPKGGVFSTPLNIQLYKSPKDATDAIENYRKSKEGEMKKACTTC